MELTDYKQTPVSEMADRFREVIYDPGLLVKAMGETIEEITNGKATLVDASSPLVLSLEFQAVHTANLVHEHIATLRQMYPELALTYDELYHHMSDEDYIDRFASPALNKSIVFVMSIQDIRREAVYDDAEQCHKLIIPKDTAITVAETTFTLLYPIIIRRYPNGSHQVSRDASYPDPVYPLRGTNIPATSRKSADGVDWMFFSVEALQVSVSSTNFVVDRTYRFEKTIQLTDSFYHARVFFRNTDTGLWREIQTTHSQQTFDPSTPTALLKVTEDGLSVSMPIIYTTSGLLSGEIRVDVYETKGEVSLDLSNASQDNFTVVMSSIDPERDQSAYTAAMSGVSFYVYSPTVVEGGSSELSFEKLRERVKYHTLGDQTYPITNVEIETNFEKNGFDLVRMVDTVTNRIFLATRRLSDPRDKRLVTPANIGMVSFAGDLSDFSNHDSSINNGIRTTIRSKALWLDQNGKVTLLPKAHIDALYAMGRTNMVSVINGSQYLYTPFWYVLDASNNEFDLRAYSLDQPKASNLNFIRQNQTLQLFVNIASYTLTKVLTGYELRVLTTSGSYYKNAEDAEVGIQLAFHPKGEGTYAYINGELVGKDESGERLYLFRIETNHDIDGENLICVTNSTVEGVTNYQAWIDLETEFNLLHWSTSLTQNFATDETDLLLAKFMLPAGAAGNSHETLNLTLGHALTNLWRRARSFVVDKEYLRHAVDVPLLWENDVFDPDPVTGASFYIDVDGELAYRYLHRKDDPVLDDQGNPVYRFKAGDPVLDANGDPIVIAASGSGKSFDILVVDGKYFFSDDAATIDYRKEVDETLTTWITEDVSLLQRYSLDKTSIFYYPKTTLGTIKVQIENGGTDYLSAEQSFTVTLLVKKAIYDDNDIRETLTSQVVKLLDSYLSNQVINMTEIREALKESFGNSVDAFQIYGLGGDKDYQLIRVDSAKEKLCLKKMLVLQADQTLIVKDAVNVEFKLSSV